MTTQNCAECGTRAEPGQSFCDACGSVLSWESSSRSRSTPNAESTAAARANGSAPTATAAPTTAPPAGQGTQAPRQGPTAQDTSTPPEPPSPATAPATAPEGAPTAPTAPTATAATAATPSATPPPDRSDSAATTPLPTAGAAPAPAAPAAPDMGDTMAHRARSLLVPVADPEARTVPSDPAVAPVLPGVPVADRPTVRPVGPQEGESGPPCPWCATPNRVDRHFCVRCAMPLAGDERQDARPLPWWRRMFRGTQETPWAGDRPRLRRTFDQIGTWIWIAVTITAVVLGIIYIPDGYQATRDHFAKRAPVAPDSVKASRSYPGHKPELVFDKLSNTWWGPGVAQSGEGQWIEARFSEPVRLLDVIVTSGVSSRADKLQEQALPHRVKATITMKDGTKKTRNLTLDQAAGGQRRAFRVGEVSAVRFTIESAYGTSDKKQVAIAEVEFFSRSTGDGS
ncbi:NADase-type glycan-binding domain-containing protein [Streptomyces sp. NPDC090994]|uniref:NADase-type glycan-binding domain-containing protein n=1 Tax=Streptomyces sp. NPDC090994 TaxID=3365969 RepID=UPI0037F43ABF